MFRVLTNTTGNVFYSSKASVDITSEVDNVKITGHV